ADQENLQQLLAVRLEVREQPDLFEQRRFEVLRLVDDQYGATAARVRVEQVRVQRVGQALRRRVGSGDGDAELVADRLEELDERQARVVHERRVDFRRQLVEQRAREQRLAGADLAGQQDEAAALGHAI